jgi:RND family efflux transporter MFP subunit
MFLIAGRTGVKRYQICSIILLLSTLTSACGRVDGSANASAFPPTPVQLQTLQTRQLQDSTDFVGTLEAEQTVDLKPQIVGQISRILVKPGDRVQPGDVVFELNPDQTVPQLNSALASVNSAKSAVNTAAQQLQAAKSQLASAQSQYELAQVNNSRYQYLAQQGAIDRMTADQYATALKVQANAVNSAKDQVRAAQAGLSQAKAGVAQAQAQANAARVNVNFKQVTAPISGSVGNITLKVGDYVNAGDTLTTINQNNTFDLQIPIPLNRARQLHPGLVTQLIDPTTGAQVGMGTIYFVSPQADATNQTILTRARFSNTSGKLRDAQYVRARVIWDTKPGVLVPVDAVTTIGGQSFVFVAVENTAEGKTQMMAHQIPITLGAIQGQNYQVLKGLESGDKVIVSGVQKLRDRAPIAPQT